MALLKYALLGLSVVGLGVGLIYVLATVCALVFAVVFLFRKRK